MAAYRKRIAVKPQLHAAHSLIMQVGKAAVAAWSDQQLQAGHDRGEKLAHLLPSTQS
jgi:hypothetical protein